MRLKLIALALATGTQITAVQAQPVVQSVAERPRIIVEGYGEVKSAPDVAVIGYSLRGEGATSDDAVRAMVASGSRIEAALRTIDPAAQPKTGNVRVTAVTSSDCKERDDGELQLSTGACAIAGYIATQSITVRTGMVKHAGTMVGLIGRHGGQGANIRDFDLRDPRQAQRQATAAALTDAGAKAAVIASAGHVALGRLLSVTTTGRNGAEIVLTGTLRQANVREAPAVAVNLDPEPIVTGANLTVTYAIGQ